MSTITAWARPPRGCAFSTGSIAENGSSKGRFMNTWPSTCATSTLRPPGAVNSRCPRPGARLGEVERAQDARLGLDELQHVLLVEGVIAQRHAIGPGGQQRLGMLAAQPRAAGGVLAVDHDEIQPPVGAQARQVLGHRRAPGAAHHIAQKQQSHGPVLGAATGKGKRPVAGPRGSALRDAAALHHVGADLVEGAPPGLLHLEGELRPHRRAQRVEQRLAHRLEM